MKSGIKLDRLEKLGLLALLLFVVGWAGLFLYTEYGMGDPKLTVKAKDIMRYMNKAFYNDAANIHLPEYIDKVEIVENDSITPSGANFYKFRYRIRSEENGLCWKEGSVEEKDMQYSNLQCEEQNELQ